MKKNVKCKLGIFVCESLNFYIGEWANDQIEGKGVLMLY